MAALQPYEDQVIEHARQLERAIAQNVGQPINVNQYFQWFSFDVMGQFAFSRSFNMLKDKKEHHAVKMLRAGLGLVGPFTPVPWLVRIAFDIPVLPIVRNFQKMEAWSAERIDERIKVPVNCAKLCIPVLTATLEYCRSARRRNAPLSSFSTLTLIRYHNILLAGLQNMTGLRKIEIHSMETQLPWLLPEGKRQTKT